MVKEVAQRNKLCHSKVEINGTRMKQKRYLVWALGVIIMVIVFYSFQGGQSTVSYMKEIEKERAEKDNFMRNDKDSPFQGSLAFKGLSYYPPDPQYKIKARFTPSEKKNCDYFTHQRSKRK